MVVFPALFWGALLLSATEPWPLSLRQGPDTAHARQGYERLFGFAPDASLSSLYFYSFNVRDASYYVRFRFDDAAVIDEIVQARDLVEAPDSARRDTRFDLRASSDHLSWWPPETINAAESLFVDRRTGEKIAGAIPWNSPIGFSRLLWVDERNGLAFYREIEF